MGSRVRGVSSGLSRADARRSRRLLIDAGIAAFVEGGIDVRVVEITRRAGLAKGTFFRHFPTKRALLVAILIESLDGLTLLAEDYAERSLDEVIPRFAEAAAEQIVPLRAVIENAVLADVATEGVEEPVMRLLGRIDVLRNHALARGEIRSDITAEDIFEVIMCATIAAYRPMPGGNSRSWRRNLALGLDGLGPAAVRAPLPRGNPARKEPPRERGGRRQETGLARATAAAVLPSDLGRSGPNDSVGAEC